MTKFAHAKAAPNSANRKHETGKKLRKARNVLNHRMSHYVATKGRAKHDHKVPGSMKINRH